MGFIAFLLVLIHPPTPMCMCAFGIFTFSPDFTRFLNYQRVHMMFGNFISKLKKRRSYLYSRDKNVFDDVQRATRL